MIDPDSSFPIETDSPGLVGEAVRSFRRWMRRTAIKPRKHPDVSRVMIRPHELRQDPPIPQNPTHRHHRVVRHPNHAGLAVRDGCKARVDADEMLRRIGWSGYACSMTSPVQCRQTTSMRGQKEMPSDSTTSPVAVIFTAVALGAAVGAATFGPAGSIDPAARADEPSVWIAQNGTAESDLGEMIDGDNQLVERPDIDGIDIAPPRFEMVLPEPADDASTDEDDAGDDESEDDEDDDFVPREEYDSLAERLEALEKDWGEYQEDRADEAAAKLKKSNYKLTGRVHLDNWNFLEGGDGINTLETGNPLDDPLDRWNFRRIRLELAGAVPNNMLFRMQVDFNNPATPELKDVYLGFTNLPNNQTLLIGNQKRPIGLDHLNSSRFNFYIERPLAVETFNEDARRLGICMYGYTDDTSINWRYGVFKLENLTSAGRIREDFDEGGIYGRLAASPWYDDISGGRGYLHTAIAGSYNVVGGLDDDDNVTQARFRTRPVARSTSRWYNTGRIVDATNYEQIAFETILNIGSVQLTGEYFLNPVQRDNNQEDVFLHGGYAFLSYYLTGEIIPLDRRTGTIGRLVPHENFFVVDRLRGGTGRGWGALGIGLRYDHLDLTDDNVFGGVGDIATIGVNWHWTPYSKLQTNLIYGTVEDGGAGVSGFTATGDNNIDDDFSILGFRYMIDF